MSWATGFCFWQTFRSDDLAENIRRYLLANDIRADLVAEDEELTGMLPGYRGLIVSIGDALQAIEEGEHEKAIAQCRYISKSFERGVGTIPNYETAMGWLRFAADLGDIDATIRITDTLRICVEDTSGYHNEITKTEMLGYSVSAIVRTLTLWRTSTEALLEKIRGVEVNNVAVLIDLLNEARKFAEAKGDDAIAQTASAELESALRIFMELGCVERIDVPLRQKIEPLAQAMQRKGPTVLVCREKLVKAKEFDPRPYLILNKPIALAECRPAAEIEAALLTRFPWANSAINLIAKEILLREQFGSRVFQLPPLLFVGQAGCGKTSLASHLGKLVGVPTAVYAVGGSSDNRAMQGTARGWSSGQASLIVQMIARQKIGNPIFILDEIDKASERGRNGSIWDTLHLLTERATSEHFFDDYLYCECDLSNVNYIATANSLARIPKSLVSRFRIVVVPNASPHDAHAIELGVRESFAKELDIDPRFLPQLDQDEFHQFGELVGQSLRVAQRFYTDRLALKVEMNGSNENCH